MQVTSNLVYVTKAKMRSRKRRRARQNVAQAAAANGQADRATLIRHVKALATEVGGIGKLKAMVEALQE